MVTANNTLPIAECRETDYKDNQVLKKRLWAIAEQKCLPLSVSLEITLKCNFRCVHCYNFDRSEPLNIKQAGSRPLSADEIVDIIDQVADEGCFYLSFTGGEALLHPNLNRFIEHARKRNLIVKLKTNGVLLSKDKAVQLASLGVAGVDISLYGAQAKTYDAFTQTKGMFEKTVAGIKNAQQAGLDVRVTMCLLRSNVGDVEAMIELIDGLGLTYAVNPFITERYDGSKISSGQRLTYEDLQQLYTGPLQHLMGEPDFSPERSVQCACARGVCGISSTGEVYPCIGAPVPCGNLRRAPFRDIWRHSPQLNSIRGLKLSDFQTCQKCPDRPYCGRSSGYIYVNTGDYTGAESFTCMDASARRDAYQHRQSFFD